MRISTIENILIAILISSIASAQTTITFDDQGWSSDQVLDSTFTIDNFKVSSSEKFCTNYGCNFDINSVSVYFVFQNETDQITVAALNNLYIDLNSIDAYQVSEQSTDTLVIEGWKDAVIAYSKSFVNDTTWKTLTLNYKGINKLVVKLDPSGTGGITDYNFDNFSITGLQTVAGIKSDEAEVPKDFSLSQNYPNPFNPTTTINYSIPKDGRVVLKVYDILGKEAAILVDEYKYAGNYSMEFSAEAGTSHSLNLPSGIYIYELRVGPSTGSGQVYVARKKMVLVR